MKTKEEILSDIVRIYHFLEQQNKDLNSFYKSHISNPPDFLESAFLTLPRSDEMSLALIDRVISLKESSLLNILAKLNYPEEKTQQIREMMLHITQEFHTKRYQTILDFIDENTLLTPFLRELIKSIHKIGLVFNSFFNHWQKELIWGINKSLAQKYKNLQEILEVLKPSIEVSNKGEKSDRSYSVPVFRNGAFEAVAYASFFHQDFKCFEEVFEESLQKLESIEEVCYELEQKELYLKYLKALKKAMLEQDTHELLESWREVERIWMQITTPLQIGHPLEYYEDHYRKAVAPEWDLRIAKIYQGLDLTNPNENKQQISKESFLNFYQKYTQKMPHTPYKSEIDLCVQESLQKTQSYGGQPLLFYGAELNGLFSAQVVPNDECVSAKYGKKIFYFPDRVRELACAKPFMLLSKKTFSKDFLDFNREMLFFRREDWYKVYEISTIGHEFGHILWVSLDSELVMNKSGAFKNIEEFKATMGGLAYYFTNQDHTLLKELIYNTISRAVGLIAWKKEDEVLPYYCEGLIHLDILFSSGVLKYNGNFENIALSVDDSKFSLLIETYLKAYDGLIKVYLQKSDAQGFLDNYAIKDSDGFYQPLKEEVRKFANDYYTQYCTIGQVVDTMTIEQWKKLYLESKKAN